MASSVGSREKELSIKTRFLSVKTASKEDSVSIGFILSFLVSFMVILYIFDLGLSLILWEIFAFATCYVIFGADRVSSMRWCLYQFRNSKQTPNHPDTYYLGNAFFQVNAFKDVIIAEQDQVQELLLLKKSKLRH